MFAILYALGMVLADLFKSRGRLKAENLLLRHQLNVALRQAPPRLRLRGSDRALLVWMIRLRPSLLGAIQVVQPETVPSKPVVNEAWYLQVYTDVAQAIAEGRETALTTIS